ncbi:MAG TPA: SMC-Scp complex subunit ScpB [Thermoplasmata archaeon]|nr:SMC-Scp complex subunit ScpB [Thermoplasmata archaeon]HEV2520661.1 SMC-Scp complex subunit ScpB [Thermoplasmata archaeon]
MPSRVDQLVLRVEAVLFAAGKPLSVRELGETLGASDHRPVQRALRTLARTYEQRQTALEVRRVGDRYALQLRETFVATAHSVTPIDMAPKTIKTLTLIAYHQPIVQSRLVRMVGESAYEEVQRLRDAGLVHAEPKGATLELTTTRHFAEQFGIASTKPEEIRRFLEQKLGVPGPATPPTIGSPEPGAPGPESAPPVPSGPEGPSADEAPPP